MTSDAVPAIVTTSAKDVRNAAVQTEGQLLPYPPDSSWISTGRKHEHNRPAERERDDRNDISSHEGNLDQNSDSTTSKKSKSGIKVVDPLQAKRGARRHPRSNARHVHQRVAPDDRWTQPRENAFDGIITGSNQSVSSRSQSADKKPRSFAAVPPTQGRGGPIQPGGTEDVINDDAVEALSPLSCSPRF